MFDLPIKHHRLKCSFTLQSRMKTNPTITNGQHEKRHHCKQYFQRWISTTDVFLTLDSIETSENPVATITGTNTTICSTTTNTLGHHHQGPGWLKTSTVTAAFTAVYGGKTDRIRPFTTNAEFVSPPYWSVKVRPEIRSNISVPYTLQSAYVIGHLRTSKSGAFSYRLRQYKCRLLTTSLVSSMWRSSVILIFCSVYKSCPDQFSFDCPCKNDDYKCCISIWLFDYKLITIDFLYDKIS